MNSGLSSFDSTDVTDHRVVGQARAHVAARLQALGYGELVGEAELVVSELVTNALLYGGGCTGLEAVATSSGVRLEVADRSHIPPVLGRATDSSMTGRGLRLVASIACGWGVRQTEGGKVVWAELSDDATDDRRAADAFSEDDLLALWDDDQSEFVQQESRVHVVLGEVPTTLLLDAKAHVDNLIREFTLVAAGAQSGVSAKVPPHLTELIETVGHRFAEARLSIKHQALEAARRGDSHTDLELNLPIGAAAAGEDYLRALDESDAYCRAVRLLTLETPPQHRVFRHWYVEEIVRQVRAAAAGAPPPAPKSFEQRLLEEVGNVAAAARAADRAARLYAVAGALGAAGTPEAVSLAVLQEGVAALGASGGALVMAAGSNRLAVPGTVGYDEEVLARLRDESPDAELPAAVALRTGDPVWLESREERDQRFPELEGRERSTVAMCAVPLIVQGRRLGALRFSFEEPRLFDEDERRFVLALAGLAAQALDRARLHTERVDVGRRLQRGLLPPRLPELPGVDLAGIYKPHGDGVEVGGDFYDVWEVAPGRWGLAIGDATGTGPEAAPLTALVRYTTRALAMSQPTPEALVRLLNEAVFSGMAADVEERFCTAVFGLLTVLGRDAHVQLAGGGHPCPILRRADGETSEVTLGGTLLGAFPDVEVATSEVVLRPGDTLVLVTDGVLESGRGRSPLELADMARLFDHSPPEAASIASAIEAAVVERAGGRLEDDMAVLVFHVPR